MLVPEKYGCGGLSLILPLVRLSLHLQLSLFSLFCSLLFPSSVHDSFLLLPIFSNLWVRFVSLGLLLGLIQWWDIGGMGLVVDPSYN